MTNRRFDGFAINLEPDDDGAWLAHFVEAPEISAFAETPGDALAELVAAWEAVKETYRAEGLPVPIAPARKPIQERSTSASTGPSTARWRSRRRARACP